MLRPAVQHSHQTVVSSAIRHLQPDVSGVRNTGNASGRERYRSHFVSSGAEHIGKSESRVAVHGAPMDVCRYRQTVAVPDTHGRDHIAGEYDCRYR